MKQYFLVILLFCVFALSTADWVQVWHDNFNYNGSVDIKKWDFDEGGSGWGNNEEEYYTRNRKQNARCEFFRNSCTQGRLIIEARKENYGNRRYTSARLKSKASWTYGRLQVRAKLPTGRGLWPAIWMLPVKQTYGTAYWPDNGEIDVMEQVGYDPLRIVSSVHTKLYNHINGNTPSNGVIVNNAVTDFNVYTLQWDVNQLQMFVGNETDPFRTRILVWDKQGDWTTWPFDQPFYLIMNIAVGGSWGGSQGIDDSIFPRRMEIDWVRFSQWK